MLRCDVLRSCYCGVKCTLLLRRDKCCSSVAAGKGVARGEVCLSASVLLAIARGGRLAASKGKVRKKVLLTKEKFKWRS